MVTRSAEGAGCVGADGATVSVRDAIEAGSVVAVGAGGAVVTLACSMWGRSGVDTSGNVARTVTGPARGSRGPRPGVVGRADAPVVTGASVTTTVLSEVNSDASTVSAVDRNSVGGGVGMSDERVEASVNVMARGSAEAGAGVVGTAMAVGGVAVNVACMDDIVLAKDAAESGSWVVTSGAEDIGTGAEAGSVAEGIVVVATGKTAARGTGAPRVGAGAPTVLIAEGTTGGVVVRRERGVAGGTVLGSAGAASVSIDGWFVTEARLCCLICPTSSSFF